MIYLLLYSILIILLSIGYTHKNQYNYLKWDEYELFERVKKLTSGVSYLAHTYNDPTKPRQEEFQVPAVVWVIFKGKIQPAVLMRVPKLVPGSPLVGVIGLYISESQQRMVEMWQICKTKKEACESLERINQSLKS